MGGPGSGRLRKIHNRRELVEDAYILDASALMRAEIFKRGRRMTVVWDPETKKLGPTGFRVELDVNCQNYDPSVVLRYRSPTEGRQPVATRVLLTTTVPYGGGVRWWFQCPGKACLRRSEKLYLPPNEHFFCCRHCHRLVYQSQMIHTMLPMTKSWHGWE